MPPTILRPEILDRLLRGELPPDQAARVAKELESTPWFSEIAAKIGSREELLDLVRSHPGTYDERLQTLVNAAKEHTHSEKPFIDATGVQEDGSGPMRAIRAAYDFLSAPRSEGELGQLAGYRVLKLLGEGGMGMVFMAEDQQLKRKVALKVMKPEIAATEVYRQRFIREAQTVAQVESDYIIPIYQVGQANGVSFIAMPLLKGESLDDRLKKQPQLPLPDLIRFGRQIAEGLAAAHEANLIHRDIKPANVWLESPSDRVRILDFGLARNTSNDTHLTQSGVMMGTPAYMAPEQARGANVDHRVDLFSLGVMLYQMSTGTRPFKGSDVMALLTSLAMDNPPSPAIINPQLPHRFAELVMKLLEKDAAKRPQSAREVAEILRGLETNPTQTKLPPVRKKPRIESTAIVGMAIPEASIVPTEKKSSLGLILGLVVAVSGLAVGGYFLFKPNELEPKQVASESAGKDKPLGVLPLLDKDKESIREKLKEKIDLKKTEEIKNTSINKIDVKKSEEIKINPTPKIDSNPTPKIDITPKKEIPKIEDLPKKKDFLKKKNPPTVQEQDRLAAEWVQSVGGWPTIEMSGKTIQLGAKDPLPTESFALTEMNIEKCTWTTASLAKHRSLPNLTKVLANGTDLTDGDLAVIGSWDHVKFLHVSTNVQSKPNFSEKGLASLKGMKALTMLYLANRSINDAGLIEISLIPTLEYLSIDGDNLTSDGYAELRKLKNLKTLLINDFHPTDKNLTALGNLTQLTKLNLKGFVIPPLAREKLKTALPKCELEITNTKKDKI